MISCSSTLASSAPATSAKVILGVSPRQQLRLRLPEGERLRPARLHLTEQEEPEGHDQQRKQERAQVAEDRGLRVLGLDDDVVVAQPLHFLRVVLHGQTDGELRHVPILHMHFLLEVTQHVLAVLDGGARDVVPLKLLAVLGVVDLRGGILSPAGELDERDRDRHEHDPERQRLRETPPIEVALLRRRSVSHSCGLPRARDKKTYRTSVELGATDCIPALIRRFPPLFRTLAHQRRHSKLATYGKCR